MIDSKINFHPNFLELFSKDELEDIVENAISVSKDCIVIITKDYFFELSADVGESLNIYCDDNTCNKDQKLTKDEFMKLYKKSILLKCQDVNIDE